MVTEEVSEEEEEETGPGPKAMTDTGATAAMRWDTGPETVQEIEGGQETEGTGLTVG